MTSVALEYRQCHVTRPPDPHAGLDAVVDGLVGRYRRRAKFAAALRGEAEAIDARQ